MDNELFSSESSSATVSTATSATALSADIATSFNETFTVNDVNNNAWIIGSVADSDRPFLTANDSDVATSGKIPGNPTVQLDTSGNGALRLTNAEQYQAGFALLDKLLSTEQGIKISFDFFAYGGTGADGISVLLLDGSQPLPTNSGAYGGALGYAQRDTADLPTTIPGITGGYLGIGFDAFGNFSNPTEGREGGVGFVPDAVVLRGSAANDYEYLTGNEVPFSLDNPGSEATREASLRTATIELTAEGLLTVTVQADLNQDGDFDVLNETVTPIDAFDVDAVNGVLPDSFRIGFAGATGAATNIHEIRNVQIQGEQPMIPETPVTPKPPVIPPTDGSGDGDDGDNDNDDGDDGGPISSEIGSSHCKPGRNIRGDHKNNKLKGGKNSDRILGKNGNDRLSGGDCGDYIDGGRGKDVIYGGGKRDHLRGGRGSDRIHGNQGDDIAYGGLGKDRLKGGRGNDVLQGNRGDDNLHGKHGDDRLDGGRNRDKIKGGTNHDRLRGNQNNDVLIGQKGADTLNGGLANDRLNGGVGHDVLRGGKGNDTLNGGAGRDTLYGGAGDDVLVGSRAADVLVGGAGKDRFVFKSIKDQRDRITDFEVVNDTIDLRPIFTKIRYASINRFSDYVNLVQQGANTIVQVDANGDLAPGGFKALAILENILATNVGANNFVV